MKVGDILTGDQLDVLPRGSVVVHDEDDGWGFNTVTRAASGYSWYSQSRSSDGHHDYYDLGEIVVDGWTVVHLPAVSALKVGDVIETEAQFRALPVGAVAVDPTDEDPESRPAVKIAENRWMYHDGEGVDTIDNELMAYTPHTLVYIPARADTGAGSTAA